MIRFFLKLALRIKKIAKRKLDPVRGNWLNRKEPFSKAFGLDRGAAIDRRFMEEFLFLHNENIQGKVLEIGGDQYTYQFGTNLVSTSILAGSKNSPRSSCFPYPLYDLTAPNSLITVGKYDCVIATNVLNFIYDLKAAIQGLARIVQPDSGVLLATLAGVSQISRFDYDRWGDYWRLNDMSVCRLFEEYFEEVEIIAYGNAPLAAAFIMGLSQEEVPGSLFEYHDPDYQILIGVKASKPKLSYS
jgi:hypothetical protein